MVKNPNFKYPEAVVKFFYRNRGYSLLPDDEKFRLQQILLFWTLKDRAAWNNFLAGLIKQRICVKYLTDQALNGVISAARQSLAQKFGKKEIPFDPDVPACFYWTEEQCADWIVECGFPEMKEAFLTNHITGRKLVAIDASALNKMGVRYFETIKAITAKIREVLLIPRPNLMRAIMRMVPMERFLRKKVYRGRNYDVLTFKEFCENEGFPHSLLLRTSKTAELPMTCKTKFYLNPETITPVGSDEGSETISLLEAPSVEFIARNTMVRNRLIQNIIEEMLYNVMLPPGERKYGAVIYRTISEMIELAMADLGMEPGSRERIDLLSEIGKNLLDELHRTHEVLKDIQVTRKFIKKDITEEVYEDMKSAAQAFNEEVFPIAALLGVGELEIESLFYAEPYYQEFVTEIAKEAEQMTNALAPDATRLVDQVIMEAKLRLLLMMFPEMTLADVKKGDGIDMDEEKIEIFLNEGLMEYEKEKEAMAAMSKVTIDESLTDANFSDDLHFGPYRMLVARKGSDLTWVEKLDSATGNPDVALLTEAEIESLLEGREFPTFDGTREVDDALRQAVQDEKNNRLYRRRMAAKEIQRVSRIRNHPAKRTEYGGYEEYAHEEKFYPDGAPILARLSTEELDRIVNKGICTNVEGDSTVLEEHDEIRSGARREIRKRQNVDALAKLQLDNYKRLFPGYLLPKGEFHEYTITEKQDLEGTPIVNRLDHLELKKLAETGSFNGTSYLHIQGLQDDARYEMQKREQEEIQARMQQQIFQQKFPGKMVLGEHQEFEQEEKFDVDGQPIVDRLNDAEIETILETRKIRLLNGQVITATSKILKQARNESAKRDKWTYRARFQQQNFRQKYPRRSFSVIPERSKIFNIHQRYDSAGKPVYERLDDEELDQILQQYGTESPDSEEALRAKQEHDERVHDVAITKHRKISLTDVSLHHLDERKKAPPPSSTSTIGGYFVAGTTAKEPKEIRKVSLETAKRNKLLDDIRELVLAATKDKDPEPVDASLALFNGFIIDDCSNVIGTVRPTDGTIRDNTTEVIGYITPDGIVIMEEGFTELGRVGADVEQIGIGKFRALPKQIPPIDPLDTYEAPSAPLGMKFRHSSALPLPGWNRHAAHVKGGVLVKEGGTWVRKDASERRHWNKQLARQIQIAEDYPVEQIVLVASEASINRLHDDDDAAAAGTGPKRKKTRTKSEDDDKPLSPSKAERHKSQEDKEDQGMIKLKTVKRETRKSTKRSAAQAVESETEVSEEYKGPRGPREARGMSTKMEKSGRSGTTISIKSSRTEFPGEGFLEDDDEEPRPKSPERTFSDSSQGDLSNTELEMDIFGKVKMKKKSEAETSFDEARRSVTNYRVRKSVQVPGSGKWGKQIPPTDDELPGNHPFKPTSRHSFAEESGTRTRSLESVGSGMTSKTAAEMMDKIASGEARRIVDEFGNTVADIHKDLNLLSQYGGPVGFIQPNGAVFKSSKVPWKGENNVRVIRQNGIVIGRINSKGKLQVEQDSDRTCLGDVWADGRIVSQQSNLVGIIGKDGRVIGETGSAIGLFTPTFEILGVNGIPFAYVSTDGKVYRYDIVPQLRYNPKSRREEAASQRPSIHVAFSQADEDLPHKTSSSKTAMLKQKKSGLSLQKLLSRPPSRKLEKTEPKKLLVVEAAKAEGKDKSAAEEMESETTLKEKERKRKTLEAEERLLRQYDEDESHKKAKVKLEVPTLHNVPTAIYSQEELHEFISKLDVGTGSKTDHRTFSTQELLLKEKQLKRRQLVENWAHDLGDDAEDPDTEAYWSVDPELSKEDQLRACRMAADSILDDIFKLALTHLLLQAEAGDDTERVLDCLTKIQTTGNDEGLTLWNAHLEQLGEFGQNLMKKVSQMLPEPGDNEVWRIVSEKAKEAKEKEEFDKESSEPGRSSKDEGHHEHHHHHHHHQHHHHHHHHHKPDLDELSNGDDKFEDPDYTEEHHHKHRHSHRHSGGHHHQHHADHKPYKPVAGPLGRVLETDEIEDLHRRKERRMSNKLPELPAEFLYGADGIKRSEMVKKREQLQNAVTHHKLPHIPHPGVVVRGGLLQDHEREDVAEQIHHGKERLAKFQTRILPNNIPFKKHP